MNESNVSKNIDETRFNINVDDGRDSNFDEKKMSGIPIYLVAKKV